MKLPIELAPNVIKTMFGLKNHKNTHKMDKCKLYLEFPQTICLKSCSHLNLNKKLIYNLISQLVKF